MTSIRPIHSSAAAVGVMRWRRGVLLTARRARVIQGLRQYRLRARGSWRRHYLSGLRPLEPGADPRWWIGGDRRIAQTVVRCALTVWVGWCRLMRLVCRCGGLWCIGGRRRRRVVRRQWRGCSGLYQFRMTLFSVALTRMFRWRRRRWQVHRFMRSREGDVGVGVGAHGAVRALDS